MRVVAQTLHCAALAHRACGPKEINPVLSVNLSFPIFLTHAERSQCHMPPAASARAATLASMPAPLLLLYQFPRCCVNASQRTNHSFTTTPHYNSLEHTLPRAGGRPRQSSKESDISPTPASTSCNTASRLWHAHTPRYIGNKPASKAGAAPCWSPRRPLPLQLADPLKMTWPCRWRNCLRRLILGPAAAGPLMLLLQLLGWRATLWRAMARAEMRRQ